MKYQVVYFNADNEECKTSIEVPENIPYYDPQNKLDVPLYITSQIEDLVMLDDYCEEHAE